MIRHRHQRRIDLRLGPTQDQGPGVVRSSADRCPPRQTHPKSSIPNSELYGSQIAVYVCDAQPVDRNRHILRHGLSAWHDIHGRIVDGSHIKREGIRREVVGIIAIADGEGHTGIARAIGIGRGCEHEIARRDIRDRDDLACDDWDARQGQTPRTWNGIDSNGRQTIARIHIAEAKVRRRQGMRRIFIDGHRRVGPGRRFIDVGHINGKRLVIGQPAAVRHPHRHAVTRRCLIVQQAAVRHRDHTGIRINSEPPTGTIRETVGLAITTLGVRPAHRPHHRPIRRILHHRIRRQTQVCWRIVDCLNIDQFRLGHGSATIPVRQTNCECTGRRRGIVTHIVELNAPIDFLHGCGRGAGIKRNDQWIGPTGAATHRPDDSPTVGHSAARQAHLSRSRAEITNLETIIHGPIGGDRHGQSSTIEVGRVRINNGTRGINHLWRTVFDKGDIRCDWSQHRCIVDRGNRHRRTPAARQGPSGALAARVAIAERPVNLDRGGGGITAIAVCNLLHR